MLSNAVGLFQTCVEVAESRTLNWQKFCLSEETVLPFLLQVVSNGPFFLHWQLLANMLF
jgi:hypothetical protein